MSVNATFRWHDGALRSEGDPGAAADPIEVADSWLVSDGKSLAVGLHRDRFLNSVARVPGTASGAAGFWDAAIAAIPRHGDWFPRVEMRAHSGGHELLLRVRPAPQRDRSVVVASHAGSDPRTVPAIKGPDLETMATVREGVRSHGAGEAIILNDGGYIVEGAYSALAWWRGNILCAPPSSFERVDSVTSRSLLGLAVALGAETYEEAVTPAELEGTELWALNALHGPRIVTRWVGGPLLAELPGRLATWRARLGALRQPL